MIAVECISAAAEIVILSARCEHVVDAVVDALETHKRAPAVTLGGMVEYYIQNDLDLVFLQDLDQSLEFGTLLVVFDRSRICCVGGKKGHCIVSPVFQKAFSVMGPGIDGLVKLKDGHELDGSDAKTLQMRYFFNNTGESARIFHTGRPVAGESAYMHLIDDGIFHPGAGKIRLFPHKIVLDDPGMIGAGLLGRAPGALACDCLRVRIQNQFFAIENQAL